MFKKWRYRRKYRRIIQISALALNNASYLSVLKFCPTPGMNCYACPLASFACPIGSLQHFMIIQKIPLFLMGFFTMIGSFFGRMVCGWVCPIGWLQEMIHKIPSPKFKVNFKPLKYLKYGVLVVLVLLIPFITKEPWFSKLCFVGTIEAGIPLVIFDQEIRMMIGPLFFVKIGITVILFILFVFIKRPFCRFLCPLGAIYSLFNKVSYLHLEVDAGCTKCNQCAARCPMEIKVYENPDSTECIRCLECTTCAHVSFKAGRERVKKQVEIMG